ncbi:MAG: hypothetical protein K6E38_05710 [Fretibacterium sp.]|nr:hypothetical protein [Fretibacterium sp.]
MTKIKRETSILLSLALFFLVVAGSVHVMRMQIEKAWNRLDAMDQYRADLNGMLNVLTVRRSLRLEALKQLEEVFPSVPEKEALRAQAEEVLRRNSADLLSAGSDETFLWEDQGGPDSLKMTFRGEYCDVIQVLAGWRTLPLRVAALTLRAESSLPSAGSGGVKAYAILEPLDAQQKN